jgi:predicted nucleic acid-binding protein
MPKRLDTTVLIDHSVDLPGAVAIVTRLFEETDDILVCDAVVAEALSSGTEAERRTISALIDALGYVSAGPDAARWAGEARRLHGLGGPRSLGDALIGGVAMALGATVVTRNPDDFVRMGVPVLASGVHAPGLEPWLEPGLTVEPGPD